MADTQTHPPAHKPRVAHGSDMVAAFAGLAIGAIALLLLLGAIVMMTNRYYASEKPAAGQNRSR
jgi:hypothetical protein